MICKETPLEGCYIIEPEIFNDHRGRFLESFNRNVFERTTGLQVDFVQDNLSYSFFGVLRGLHFQTGESAQAKLVRVPMGSVIDVAVDIRPNSKTFGEYFSIELSEGNQKQLFVPRGFAHGFLVTSPSAIFSYKCDNFYNKEAEGGIRYDDPRLDIDWNLLEEQFIISKKDRELPSLSELVFS